MNKNITTIATIGKWRGAGGRIVHFSSRRREPDSEEEGTNGYTNVYTNGYTDVYTNGYTDVSSNGYTDVSTNGYTYVSTNGYTNAICFRLRSTLRHCRRTDFDVTIG